MTELFDAGRRCVKGRVPHPGRTARRLALAAGLLGGLSAAVQAQQDLTAGGPTESAALQAQSLHPLVGPDLVARLVQLTGHRLQQAEMTGPNPSLLADAGGFVYGIDFYQCTAAATGDADTMAAPPRCASIRFSTAVDMPAGMAPSAANAWNRDRRFGRLWLDEEGDPHLEMDVSTAGGVTTAHLVDLLDWWSLVMSDFLQQVQLSDEAPLPAGSTQAGAARQPGE
ncbi:YbjN domain-containing protein [Marinibaculum pumilum]|uniref:YbjN domain-containing protein n=1 Tax=Marinibaculum pumilum TaxID=1766165 RepID=A0ABV7LA88_9PROT